MQPTFVRRIKTQNRRNRGVGSRTRKTRHLACTKTECVSPSKPVAVAPLAINATILNVEDFFIPASPIADTQPPPAALECSLNTLMDVEVVPERSISLEEELFHSMFAFPSYLDASPEPASPTDLICATPLPPTPGAFPALCTPLPINLFAGDSFAQVAFNAAASPPAPPTFDEVPVEEDNDASSPAFDFNPSKTPARIALEMELYTSIFNFGSCLDIPLTPPPAPLGLGQLPPTPSAFPPLCTYRAASSFGSKLIGFAQVAALSTPAALRSNARLQWIKPIAAHTAGLLTGPLSYASPVAAAAGTPTLPQSPVDYEALAWELQHAIVHITPYLERSLTPSSPAIAASPVPQLPPTPSAFPALCTPGAIAVNTTSTAPSFKEVVAPTSSAAATSSDQQPRQKKKAERKLSKKQARLLLHTKFYGLASYANN